jgi:hypothetical protein
MSDIIESSRDQQNDAIDQKNVNADKEGEIEGQMSPEEVTACESSETAERDSVPSSSVLQLPAAKPDTGEEVSEVKASKRKPLPFQLMEVEIGTIHSEHSAVDKVRDEAAVQLRELPTTVLSRAGLMEIATHFPLQVVLESEKYYCIGGLRFFRLIRYGLPADAVIPVFLYGGLNAKRLRSHILFDLFMMPAVASLDMHDRRSLNEIWTRLCKEELFGRFLGCKVGEALSKLLNSDLRTGKARNESGRSKPE